ncbi:hypothetical protein qu_564 [Acanthamoeba polyphaga mimivirus]|nr:hypothetical protein [Mimivirus reunion]WMV61898.1 hypothetical protein qu_564 [Mimivirus sp.]WMV62875.1 hypothetical protein qu_564 [Acanthamoeba polyphaga mimivirus]WMV63852.1 hypothetical protein qu_564 [Mimivirus sp.]
MMKSTNKSSLILSSNKFVCNNITNGKPMNIPVKNHNKYSSEPVSRSWGQIYSNNIDRYNLHNSKLSKKKYNKSPYYSDTYYVNYDNNDFNNRPYDAIKNCKSAGIIPYTFKNGELYFLFQRAENPQRKKDSGWNDFGGKQLNSSETTADIAAREFSEETSCLFYLLEKLSIESNNNNNNNIKFKDLYDLLKNNDDLFYSRETIVNLKKLIIESKKFYSDKITEYVLPIFLSSKETYISYFVRVKYIPESDLPKAEDFHIPYEDRYLRECRWFSLDDLMNLNEKDFHKRLQITRIQQRIAKYYEKGLFS